MTDDLVTRLNMASVTTHPMTLIIVIREAAAFIDEQKKRIEELEAALCEIVAMTPDPEFGTPPIGSAIKVACAALGEKK